MTKATLHETSLERSRTSRTYHLRLNDGLDLFTSWLSQFGIAILTLVAAPLEMDQALCECLSHCFDAGVKLWRARCAVLAVQTRWRVLKGRLPRAWDCIKSWTAKLPVRNRPPLPLDLLKAMSAVALSWGLDSRRLAHLLIPFSVLIRVGFFGLLRVGELCRLTVADVLFPALGDSHNRVVLVLKGPKNKAHMGRNQFALLDDDGCIQWLRWLVRGLLPNTRLWPSTSVQLRHVFSMVLSRMGLQNLRLLPGSLRPGGVTELVLRGVDIHRIKFMARWKNEQSLASYIQEAVAQLVWLSLDQSQRDSISDIVAQSLWAWSSAPSAPWLQFFGRARQWRAPLRSVGSTSSHKLRRF